MPRKKATRKLSGLGVVANPDAVRRRLRARARQRLRKRPADNSEWADAGARKLVHEPQVHQVELEMQNEELRRVQLELAASLDRFAALYDFAPVAYLTLDADGVVREANLAAAAQLGVVRQDLISQKLARFISRESQEVFYQHRQLVFSTGVKQTCELKLGRADGSFFPAALESIVSQGGKAGARRCLVAFTDITERKRAQAELVQNISTLPEENPNPTLRISAEGMLTYSNPASAAFLADLGWKVGRLVSAEWLARIREVLKCGTVEELEISLGAQTYFCTLIPFAEHGFVNLYGRDITARKQAETAVRQSEERHRALVEATATVVWRTTPDGNMVFATGAWSRITGQTQAQIAGWGWLDAIHPDDRAPTTQKWRHSLETRTLHENELRVRTRGGDYRWFQVRGVPVFNPDGTVREWVGADTDIHAHKQAEAALKLSASQMHAALESTADGLLVVDTAGHITHFNRRFVEFWRLPAALLAAHDDERMLRFVLNQLAQPREFLAKVRQLYRAPTVDSFDVIRFKDGRIFERYSRPQWLDERPVGRVWSFRDVTAHHQTEAALRAAHDHLETRVRERTAELEAANASLRESEQRFSQVVENIEEVFWMTDVAKRKMFFVSAAYEKIWGQSRDSFYAKPSNWLQGIHRADRARIRQAALTKQAGGEYDEVYRVVRPDGTERWIHDRAFPIRDANGTVCRITGLAEDITERKLVEAALLESKHFFQSALDALSAHIGILDGTGRIVSVNAAWQRFAQANGLTLAACGAGANYLEICDHASGHGSAEAAAVARGIRKVMARHAPAFQLEYPCHSPKELRWFVVRVTRFEGAGPVRLAVAHENITERKQMEEALRRSEQELADFFEQSPTGLLWANPDGRILKLNRAQQKLFGCRGREALGHDVAEFLPGAGPVTSQVAKGETVLAQRMQFRQKNGILKHVLIDANGLWAGGRLIHSRWFVRDITRVVELEREILSISEREQFRMSQDLHDDLGQQLTGIQFLTDTLAAELEEKSKAARAREIAELVRNAMTQTRELARGLFPVSMEAEGLADALKQLAARITRIFRRECRFRCPAPVQVPDHAMGTHLYRIAQEAVSNAIRHGKARRIEIALTRTENQLVLEISDEGAGLPRKPKKEKGIGRRIMQYRAGVIGGVLLVQRRPAGGTEVVCTIPAGQLPKHAPTSK